VSRCPRPGYLLSLEGCRGVKENVEAAFLTLDRRVDFLVQGTSIFGESYRAATLQDSLFNEIFRT
jgi:hypothetical protein